MAITERTRHELFLRLEELLGSEEATTLMEHLPPVGWADVATKVDLDHLRSDLAQLEERLDLRFEARLKRALREQTRTLLLANIGYMTAFGSLILAAAKL